MGKFSGYGFIVWSVLIVLFDPNDDLLEGFVFSKWRSNISIQCLGDLVFAEGKCFGVTGYTVQNLFSFMDCPYSFLHTVIGERLGYNTYRVSPSNLWPIFFQKISNLSNFPISPMLNWTV